MSRSEGVTSFDARVSDAELTELRSRLGAARLPERETPPGPTFAS